MEAEKAILDLRYLMWLSINIIDEYIIRYNLVKDFETFLLYDDLPLPDCIFCWIKIRFGQSMTVQKTNPISPKI